MSKGFSINDILGNTKANAPAGQKMQVVMLPEADIEPNPENSIYEIGDVSMLKADIAERGLRSPLEVLPAQNGKYMLLAGHRRWTACRALTAEGVAGFEVLPCVIRQSQGEDDDLIALITSNATARELTDGERLRQYRALKQALERKKAAGALDGRIRDEMSRITGDGTGTLGRLNAIANNCVPEVLAMVERGEITMTRAYECSKLYKVQQVEYAKNKYASMPPITDTARRAAIKYLVECGLADQFKKLDYVRNSEWNYADRGLDVRKLEPVTLDLTEGETDALLRIEPVVSRGVRVQMRDPVYTDEVLAESLLYPRDFYDAARRAYINKDDLVAYKAEVKGKRDQERARQEEAGKWQALARQELEAFDNWPLVTRLKDLGLTIAEGSLSKRAEFLTKYCNIKQNSSLAWLSADVVERACGAHIDPANFKNCYCVGGIDLSRTTDLTACVAIIEKDARLNVLAHFFLPAEKLQEATERDGLPYAAYVQRGILTLSGDNFVDYHDCYNWFRTLIEQYKIYPLQVGYDRYTAQYLVQDMKQYGFHMDDVFQGFNLTPVIREVEGLLKDGTINIGDNDLLKVHLLNTALKVENDSGRCKLVKMSATDHIDGCAALMDGMTVRQKWCAEIGGQLKNAG